MMRNYTFCVDMAAAFAGPFPLALEPMVFSGDVMQYRKWVKQFENIIEPSVKDNHLRLFYLEKYTAGEAREVIEGFLQVRISKSVSTNRIVPILRSVLLHLSND